MFYYFTAVCNIECRNGGECVAPDACKCKDGFEGKFCQLGKGFKYMAKSLR